MDQLRERANHHDDLTSADPDVASVPERRRIVASPAGSAYGMRTDGLRAKSPNPHVRLAKVTLLSGWMVIT